MLLETNQITFNWEDGNTYISNDENILGNVIILPNPNEKGNPMTEVWVWSSRNSIGVLRFKYLIKAAVNSKYRYTGLCINSKNMNEACNFVENLYLNNNLFV